MANNSYQAGLTLKDAGGWNPPYAQEIGCHFSRNDPNVLKIPDFFKNDVEPRVKESFLAYLEWLSRNWTKFDKKLQIFEAKIINFDFIQNFDK